MQEQAASHIVQGGGAHEKKAECAALDELYCINEECRFYKDRQDMAGYSDNEHSDTQNMSMAVKLIRAQGEQIRRMSAEEYLKDKVEGQI